MNDSLRSRQDPEVIQKALHKKSIAVVGMSANPLRASNFVGYYLMRNGYRVTPVNPREAEIYGCTCYPNLGEIPYPIDVVDVFRDPGAVPDIAREAVEIGAGYLWLQFGVISPQGVRIAEAGNIQCVVDQCIKIEHARYMGRMHWLGFNTGRIDARRKSAQESP